MKRRVLQWFRCCLAACALACAGHSERTELLGNGASLTAGMGGQAGFGGLASGGSGTAGAAPGGAGGGAVAVAGGAEACRVDGDCAGKPCVLGQCSAGRCRFTLLAFGTFASEHDPADCHVTVCDGEGNTIEVVDPTFVPMAMGCTQA